ncbi:hypothetical protein Pmar_PMAR025669, partial [Perkinsus marinus ATCC 50983]
AMTTRTLRTELTSTTRRMAQFLEIAIHWNLKHRQTTTQMIIMTYTRLQARQT